MVKLKPVLIQLAWLALALIISILIIFLFWKWNFHYHFITINILGARVGFSEMSIVLSTWLLVSFIIFVIKEFWVKQNRIVGKTIAIVAGISFIISLNYVDGGWTSYPSLESIGQMQLTPETFAQGILLLQVVTGVAVVILLFWWSRKRAIQPV